MRLPRRAAFVAVLALCLTGSHLLGSAAPATASRGQVAIIQDDPHMLADPLRTLQTFRALGAQVVRVSLTWSMIAPDWDSTAAPTEFNASDPAAYPPGAWDPWDAIVRDAKRMGIAIDFILTGGAPRWADGPGMPEPAASDPHRAWYPSAADYGAFVRAVATRYSGGYPDPQNGGQFLPRVSFWSIWNEPNFGEDLGPQATDGSSLPVAPMLYRRLVNAGWKALQVTGHGHDTILIGGLAAQGISSPPNRSHPDGLPGDFSQTKPLVFLRWLYCVDANFHRLRGHAARRVGCPATAAGSGRFRAANPGLFQASGVGDHPYDADQSPITDRSHDPSDATFPQMPLLETELDHLQRVYGSHARLPVYNDEWGYITHPPNRGSYVSTTTAAYYLNWAEYLSWRERRIASTMQYLLYDPPPSRFLPQGGFASGLLTTAGRRKPAFAAYRMPLYLPRTTIAPGHRLEVWGCVRPAHFAALDTGRPQLVAIQLRHGTHGPFTTLRTVHITSPRGYFDVRMIFPATGSVRLAWSYPAGDPLLPSGTVYSRDVGILVR